jgi:hypothetical protein
MKRFVTTGVPHVCSQSVTLCVPRQPAKRALRQKRSAALPGAVEYYRCASHDSLQSARGAVSAAALPGAVEHRCAAVTTGRAHGAKAAVLHCQAQSSAAACKASAAPEPLCCIARRSQMLSLPGVVHHVCFQSSRCGLGAL